MRANESNAETELTELSEIEILSRLFEIGGELRVNAIRILAVGLFYIVELVNFYGINFLSIEISKVDGLTSDFHLSVTAIAAVWTFLSLGVWFFNQKKLYKPIVKYIVVGLDMFLLTFLLLIADGPKSPLVVIFFVLVVSALMRFSLPLLWFATSAALLGYLGLVVDAKWHRPIHSVPHYHSVIFSLGIVLTGLTLGQVLRKYRSVLQVGLKEAAGNS